MLIKIIMWNDHSNCIFNPLYIKVENASLSDPCSLKNMSLCHLFQDRYLLVSMLFNYLVCIWHIIVSRFEDDSDTQGTMDLYAFIATVIIYIAYQLAFLIVVVIKVSNKNKHDF